MQANDFRLMKPKQANLAAFANTEPNFHQADQSAKDAQKHFCTTSNIRKSKAIKSACSSPFDDEDELG